MLSKSIIRVYSRKKLEEIEKKIKEVEKESQRKTQDINNVFYYEQKKMKDEKEKV